MRELKSAIVSWGSKIAYVAAGAYMMTSTASAAAVQIGNGRISELFISSNSLSSLIGTVVTFALVIVGVIAVIYLIFGGITYVTAGGDAEKAGKGRQTITNAIIGIVIIIAALAIFNAVVGGAETGTLQ
ncbi:MAG: hypothetical protein NTZ65_00335 [Candidatus Berkelbacteria bacterium]|nr:hypothetical protein [Candidatus Berkelbacteria bacterium]